MLLVAPRCTSSPASNDVDRSVLRSGNADSDELGLTDANGEPRVGFRAPYCKDEKSLRPGERGENLGDRVGGGEAIGDAVLRARGTGFEVLVLFSPFILERDLPVISFGAEIPSQAYVTH